MKKNMFILVILLVISVFGSCLSVYASLPMPAKFSSIDEFRNTIMETKEKSETNMFAITDESAPYGELEKIASYIDFKNIAEEVELYDVSVRPIYISLHYRDKEKESSGDLVIETFRWENLDENEYIEGKHKIDSSSIDIKINGKVAVKSEVYYDNEHICNQYNWIENGHAIFLKIPTWLLELYPEETFFDVQVVNVENHPAIQLNGEILEFGDTPPVIRKERTLVPVRTIFEVLEGEVAWNGEQQMAVVRQNGMAIEMTVNNPAATVNGQQVMMDVAPRIINDKTMVPLRFIFEILGYNVEWNGETNIAIVTTE